MTTREFEITNEREAETLLPVPAAKDEIALVDPDAETLIEYRPYLSLEKWLQYRFSAWSELKAWFVITLVVVFFTCGGPGIVLQQIIRWATGIGTKEAAAAAAAALITSQQVIFWMLSCVALAIGLTSSRYLSKPTHLGISSRGMRFIYRRGFERKRSQAVTAWDRLNHVYLEKPAGKTSPQDYSLCFRSERDALLKLKLGAIPTQEERARLLAAISDYAPKMTREPEVLEVLSPPQDHSYTELWLQALSAPPKRERLTPLPEGGTLQDCRYTVSGQLGVGGQGTAYLARDHESEDAEDDVVVLKESILPVYVDVNVRKQALDRFQNEAAMLRKLDHPQVVRLVDFFVEDHRSYLVLEHIDGPSLRTLVSTGGKLSEERARELALQMCEILAYLHSLVPPVVHRDFTPDNLILGAEGVLKLVDFNVAHQSESTATGTVVGKHAYIPPEQFRGKPVTQSDIYAMGATLFYLVTGEDPEPISTSHPVLLREDLSPAFDRLVSRATAVEARDRYRTIQDLKTDLIQKEEEDGNI